MTSRSRVLVAIAAALVPVWILVSLVVLLVPASVHARRSPSSGPAAAQPALSLAPSVEARGDGMANLNVSAAANTTVLLAAKFDTGLTCTAQGWTKVDLTTQMGDFWHVDDFAGLNPTTYFALAGTRSLWCGARPQATGPLCGYAALPGYGNSWDQAFCTKTCIPVSADGVLDVSFLFTFDSEPSYDATSLEYTTDCSGASGWTRIDGGTGTWDGWVNPYQQTGAYSIGTTGPVKVRLHFRSDGAWSDEDGLWNTVGAAIVDNLVAEGLGMEDFEGETLNATQSDDWTTCNPFGYGTYIALFPGSSMLQQDPCTADLSCLWAAVSGSTYNYACGGFPFQTAVPFGNADGQYLLNEVWSPEVPITGSGSQVILEFDVYRDNPLNNLVCYTWGVRTTSAGGCAGAWKDRNFFYYGGQKDWHLQREPVGDLIDLVNGVSVSVSLGVRDVCGQWCGSVGTGACHSHAPLLDNVRLYRVDTTGPQWSIRDIDQFQDTFAEVSGPSAGRARADMANDISPGANYNSIIPGDSSVVKVTDPTGTLATDPGNGRAAVYCYVSVQPPGQADKTGSHLTQNPVRYPVVGLFTDAGGTSWSIVQLDSSIVNGLAQPDIYCVDLNDNLFEPGDTISFFYEAVGAGTARSYAFGSNLGAQGSDREQAAANASEFTILPAGGVARGGDVLYVDGMDGRGAQPYFDTAFQSLGIADKVDRFDVRGPSSGVSNRPAGRVKDIAQLVPAYRKILWDTGDLEVGLGNGSGTPEKTNDYRLLNQFLNNVTPSGGVYICGDDAANVLNTYQSSGHPNGIDAITFKATWLPFSLTTGNARPTWGISPVGTAVGGGNIVTDPSFVIHGGCPLINDFDVMEPQGTALNEVTYGAGGAHSTNGALLSNVVGTSRVMFGGFSFAYVRDDDANGVSDRADLLSDILTFLQNPGNTATATTSPAANSLSQNYPNPFNPQTTIAFSVKQRGLVRVSVYNVSGQLVRALANESYAAGAHTLTWDGRNDAGSPVSSGVYFYKLVAGDFSQTRKMVLLK